MKPIVIKSTMVQFGYQQLIKRLEVIFTQLTLMEQNNG